MVDQFLLAEFEYAKDHGWLDAFEKAGKDYEIPEELLMGIASRETNMRNIVGDGGHGYGLMQIDVRSFPGWVQSGAWRFPEQGIERGAQVLDQKRTEIGHGVGKRLAIGGYSFVGKLFGDQATLNRVSVADYNAGLWGYYCYSLGRDPDQFTTGKNYSADVLRRAATFAELLKEDRT